MMRRLIAAGLPGFQAVTHDVGNQVPRCLGFQNASTAWLLPFAGHFRGVSSLARRRRRAYYKAVDDPHASSAKVRKLKERATLPRTDILRHLGEHKIGKMMSFADRKSMWYELKYKKYAPSFLGQIKPRMKFWTAALDESQLPPPRLPEVAIAGRSNSGKSTLVNYLCGHHSAYMKRKPGSTTELVFWQIGKPSSLCVVDLPGYGYAMASEEKRLQWTEFTLWYVRARRNLRRVLLLINAQAGLKPTDREMISYLERHGVPWQIVVTKCDKVHPRTLAKRITLLHDEVSGFRKMVEPPLPISALKRKGMDPVRTILDKLKVRKEILKDGIRRRIYDLLEVKRLKRAEKSLLKREERAKKKAEEYAKEANGESNDAPVSASDAGKEGDLHSVLSDWGLEVGEAPAIRVSRGHDDSGSNLGDASVEASHVTEALYTLEADRDWNRIDSFMRDIFASKSDADEWLDEAAAAFPESSGPSGRIPWTPSRPRPGEDAFGAMPKNAVPSILPDFGGIPAPPRTTGRKSRASTKSRRVTGPETPSRQEAAQFLVDEGGDEDFVDSFNGEEVTNPSDDNSDDDSDESSDSDEEYEHTEITRRSKVLRFDAAPQVQTMRFPPESIKDRYSFGAPESRDRRSHHEKTQQASSSPFPGFGLNPSESKKANNDKAPELRRGWIRPNKGQDTMYDIDDFGSSEDHASGLRRYAPAAPTASTRGDLLAAARRRYEREWATELDDVELAKKPVVGTRAEAAARAHDMIDDDAASGGGSLAAATKLSRSVRLDASGGPRLRRTLIDRTGVKAGYITQQGSKKILDGVGAYRVLGRPPSRIMKPKKTGDSAAALKVSTHRGRKRNYGAGLEYDDAKDKWFRWYEKNKKTHANVVGQAPSPEREDVEAEYEDRTFRRRQPRQPSNLSTLGGRRSTHRGMPDADD